jgi:hypothetical protein
MAHFANPAHLIPNTPTHMPRETYRGAMGIPTQAHPWLGSSPLDELADGDFRQAVTRALRDGRISDAEVRNILLAVAENGLDPLEAHNLSRLVENSRTMSYGARVLVRNFIAEASGRRVIPGMPDPDRFEGAAFPGHNFAGPGYYGPFRFRPRNVFDLAAKIHDLCYLLNDIDFSLGREKDSFTQSRKAKSDYLFRAIAEHNAARPLTSHVLEALASVAFDGKSTSEFLKDDGFVNPLVEPSVLALLCDPHRYLMIPYDHLRGDQQKKETTWETRITLGFLKSSYRVYAGDWDLMVAYDREPGFMKWFQLHFRSVMCRLHTTSDDGLPMNSPARRAYLESLGKAYGTVANPRRALGIR